MVRSWSASSSKAFSCQDLLQASTAQRKEVMENAATSSLPFSRRLVRDQSRMYDPLQWNERERDHVYTENPTLQRVDRILQEARIYNKDLVIDVTDDESFALVSLYASAYGWPVLTLQTNARGQVSRMCEATKNASHHHVLPLWASNFNSLPEELGEDVEAPTVRLDQLAALTTSSTSSRIRLLHIQLPRGGEWNALMGATKLLSERRVDHVLVTLHFDERFQENDAVRVVEVLLRSGYAPMDDKDRKQRPPTPAALHEGVPLASISNQQLDATEYLRHLIEINHGKAQEVWFYMS
jgi:hypothetical protein